MIGAGGLHIIGTERHESRRIDNQLRGRSGRQGDPGSSRFYLSMEDNLMRIFGDPTRTKRLLQFAGMKEGEVIESGMLTRQIEKAQRKVESHNFDIRKQLLLFDDVANDQRKVIYQQRTEILGAADMSGAILEMFEEAAGGQFDEFAVANSLPQDWNLEGLQEALRRDFNLEIAAAGHGSQAEPEMEQAVLRARVTRSRARQPIRKRSNAPGWIATARRSCATSSATSCCGCSTSTGASIWRPWTTCGRASICAAMRRRTIASSTSARRSSCSRPCSAASSSIPWRCWPGSKIRTQEQIDREEAERRERLMRALQAQHAEAQSLLGIPDAAAVPAAAAPAAMPASPDPARAAPDRCRLAPFVRSDRKVGRNEPCPCGSGRKYKHCHGALAGSQ